MKIIFAIFMMSAMAIGLACQPAKTAPATLNDDETSVGSDGANRITLAGTKKLFDSGEALIVDTRSKSQYDEEHVKGAINLPLGDFDARWQELKTDKKIVAYCS
jgi:3-mercaptopyruvate sulfurtransferase SseA